MIEEQKSQDSQNSQSLIFGLNMIPNIDNFDFFYYLKKVSENAIAERMMNELDVKYGDKNYYTELLNKIKNFVSKEKEKFKANKEDIFLNDKPMFNNKEIHNFVVLLGTPFVEKPKQANFKIYLTTKSILTEFASIVKEIYFPYSDTEKPEKCFVIVELGSPDEARLVR